MEEQKNYPALAALESLPRAEQLARLLDLIETESSKPWPQIDYALIEACTAQIERIEQARPLGLSDDRITDIRHRNNDEMKTLVLRRGDRMLFRQFLRQPVFLACIALLLVLAVSFACIGGAAVGGLLRQYAALDDNYLTVAMPVIYGSMRGDDWVLDPNINGRYDATMINSAGERRVSEARANTATGSPEAAPYVRGRDYRKLRSVHIDGTRALTSYELSGFSTHFDAHSSELVVLAVRCTSVQSSTVQSGGYQWKRYRAVFVVEEVVAAGASSPVAVGETLEYAHTRLSVHTAEGEVPFQPDERYLVRGCYTASAEPEEKLSTLDLTPTGYLIGKMRRDESGKSVYAVDEAGKPEVTFGEAASPYSLDLHLENGVGYGYPRADGWPFYAPLGEGSVEDCLAASPVWREEIIPNCRYNHANAGLYLTENARAIYPINTGRIKLAEGRMITADEYAAGTPVCLVSAEYAALNGIAVGDTLTAEVHSCGYSIGSYAFGGASIDHLYRFPMTADSYDTTIAYTVVGILTGCASPVAHYGMSPDWIVAPLASYPDPGRTSRNHPAAPILETLLLHNGTIDDFEAAMVANRAEGYYFYYDGGYDAVIHTLLGLRISAMCLLVAGVGAFVPASALAGWLMRRRMLAPARTMRLLGVSRGRVWCSTASVMVALCWVILPIGALVGGLLYARVSGAVLSETIALNPTDLVLCALLLGLLLLLGCCGLALGLSNLSRKQNRKKKSRRAAQEAPAAEPETRPEPVYIAPKSIQSTPVAAPVSIRPDAREKALSPAMAGLFFRVLGRRMVVCALLLSLSGFGVFAALFLEQSILRQARALDDAIAGIKVVCTVTAPDGATLDGFNFDYAYLFTLGALTEGKGALNSAALWGERNDEMIEIRDYITDVRAMNTHEVKPSGERSGFTQRRILSLASDSRLDPANGATVVFRAGYGDSSFAEHGAFCLVSETVETVIGEDGLEYVVYTDGLISRPTEYRLQVIGHVKGVDTQTIWTPIGVLQADGRRISYTGMQNCSFTIADNTRLEEAKARIFRLFFDATAPRAADETREYGVIVDDRALQTVKREMTATLTLLRILTPILIALYAAIGFFGSYLPVKGRVREFAVMRSLGRTRARVFASVFGETSALALIGGALGLVGATHAGEITRAGLVGAVLVLLMFLFGAAFAARRAATVDLMQAMKGDD